MKFSYNWLKEYIKISISPKELSEKLTLAGFEVEGLIEIGVQLQHIITGQIKEISPHPNADRLVITQVFDGKETHQIVTGATNVFEDAIVPISLPGAVLANGLKIKHAKLRGVESSGMLCSEVELGVSEEATGIWILPENTPIGIDFIEFGHLKDTLLDISILPNRGDCQSILGLAREISVILNAPITYPDTTLKTVAGKCDINIDLIASDACPLYTGRLIQNVKPGITPLWLQRRLQISGIRPISPIVDVTNYVLLEMGQPLHAFDRSYLKGSKIIVRLSKNKETIETLDDETWKLSKHSLLICDEKRPIALAGIMGGKNSEIKETTTDVFLEAAYFDPGTIRQASSYVGLRTESSIRFEKGIDINNVAVASDRACHLLQTITNCDIIRDFKQETNKQYPIFKKQTIPFSSKKINALLNASFKEKDMLNTLVNLGFEYSRKTDEVTIPSWRRLDVSELPCLAEEIGRILSFDSIPSQLPKCLPIIDQLPEIEKLIKLFESSLIHQGYSQTMTFPMISPSNFDQFHGSETNRIEIQNPLSQDESVMRQSLMPSLLRVAAFNYKRQIKQLKIFETGKVFFPKKSKAAEEVHLNALCIGGIQNHPYNAEQQCANSLDIFYIKGIIETLFNTQKFASELHFKKAKDSHFHPNKCVSIFLGNTEIGKAGMLHPALAKHYNIDLEVGYLHINLTTLCAFDKIHSTYEAISKHPFTRRDLAIIAPKTLAFEDILAAMNKLKHKSVIDIFLFDSFESEQLGKDKRSLTVALLYQEKVRTLSDEEVNKKQKRLSEKLASALPISYK